MTLSSVKVINDYYLLYIWIRFIINDIQIQDQVNEWANMTGFLCALGGVCLLGKSPSRPPVGNSGDARRVILTSTSQDMQYCPVTQ